MQGNQEHEIQRYVTRKRGNRQPQAPMAQKPDRARASWAWVFDVARIINSYSRRIGISISFPRDQDRSLAPLFAGADFQQEVALTPG